MNRLILILTIILLTAVNTYAKDFSFAQEDRERTIRLEEGQKAITQKIDGIDKSVNQRIDDLRGEVRDLKTFMLWGFGIIFGGIGMLIGFVVWDRRTALAPAIAKSKEVRNG